jgi:hypothetical protein
MFSRYRWHPEEHAVVERLRAEARQSRPAFSESLHERIRAAVLPAAVRGTPVVRRPTLVWGVAGLLTAASIAVGSYSLLEFHRNARQQAKAAAALAALARLPASADVGTQEVDRLASAMLTWQPWAGLDHDARLAATSLVQCFPLSTSRPPE